MTRPICPKITGFTNRCQTDPHLPSIRVRGSLVLILLVSIAATASTGDLFDRGSEALLYDRPREAATLLEQAVAEEPVNARAYLYLALSYEQLSMHERAITTLRRAESIPGIDRGQVYFNIGNNFLQLGDAELAEEAYSQSIQVSPLSADSYLNRANVRVMQERYSPAVEDYNSVLGLAPDHRQRVEIQRMIDLLTASIQDERARQEAEARRLEMETEQRAAEEAARVAEEERQRLAAEERRRALLSNVLNSLNSATGDTTNMSAGNEEIDDYTDEEFDIAD